MSSGDFYYLVTDPLSGDVRDVVEISSFHWNEIYKSPGSGVATAKFDADTTTENNFQDWNTGFWVVENGTIRWGGIMGKIQRKGGTRVLSVPVLGFLEWLKYRFIRSTQGMVYATLEDMSDITWTNIEQFHIFHDIISHVQSFPDGNIGLSVTWDQLSGKTIDKVLSTYSVKAAAPFLTELSNRLTTGFDFEQVYYWDNGRPRCRFHLSYPQIGRASHHILLFQPERQETIEQSTVQALNTTGVSGSYASIDTGNTDVTGDFKYIGFHTEPDWTPASNMTLRSKWDPPSDKCWKVMLLTTGKIRFMWTTDGSTENTEDSDLAVSFANGETGAIKVELDVDNGAGDYVITFWQSTDYGVNWTTLDTPPPDLFGDTFGDTF